jgi:hypothetical protein
MRMKRCGPVAWSALFLVFLVLAAAAAAEASMLQNGVLFTNPNTLPATVTYSWSGHFQGQLDV